MKKSLLACLSLLIILTSCGGGKFIENVKNEEFVREFSMTNENLYKTVSLGKVKYKEEKPKSEEYSAKEYSLVTASWSLSEIYYKATFLCDKESEKVQFLGLEVDEESLDTRRATQKLIELYNLGNSSVSINSPLESAQKYSYYSTTILTIEEALSHYRFVNDYSWDEDKVDGNKVVKLSLELDPVSYILQKENSDLSEAINKDILGKFISKSSDDTYLWNFTDNTIMDQLEKKREELAKERSETYAKLKEDIAQYLLDNWNIRNRTERNIANTQRQISNMLSDERTLMMDLSFSVQLGDVKSDVLKQVSEYLKKRKEYSFTSYSLSLKFDDNKLDNNKFNLVVVFELSDKGNYKPTSYSGILSVNVEELDNPIELTPQFDEKYLFKVINAVFTNKIIEKPY